MLIINRRMTESGWIAFIFKYLPMVGRAGSEWYTSCIMGMIKKGTISMIEKESSV